MNNLLTEIAEKHSFQKFKENVYSKKYAFGWIFLEPVPESKQVMVSVAQLDEDYNWKDNTTLFVFQQPEKFDELMALMNTKNY